MNFILIFEKIKDSIRLSRVRKLKRDINIWLYSSLVTIYVTINYKKLSYRKETNQNKFVFEHNNIHQLTFGLRQQTKISLVVYI